MKIYGLSEAKVDARNQAINLRDLLVTSGQAGTEMFSKPIKVNGTQIHSPGTIIGKALEPLATGKTGEILVLLSLQ